VVGGSHADEGYGADGGYADGGHDDGGYGGGDGPGGFGGDGGGYGGGDGYDEGRDDAESFVVGHHRRGRRWFRWMGRLIAVGLLAGAVGIVWARYQVDPSGHQGAAVQVTIPKGASTSAIASLLGKQKVIHTPALFRYYVKLRGAGPLLPGTYTFHQNERYDDVIAALEKVPAVTVSRLTIPEGFTLTQIAAKVATLPGRSAAKFLAAATSGQVRSRYEPAGTTSLEGLLFPATYQVTAGESDIALLSQMVTLFDETVSTLQIDQAAAKLGLTPYQVTVIASIVEREAKLDVDRPPMASAIYNRLRLGMALQIDATLMYGEQLTDPHKIDLSTNTPYNSYKFKGLPPTPIAAAGVPSLEAAISPPTTTFIYWVLIDPSGKQAFASTPAEFAALSAQAKSKGLL